MVLLDSWRRQNIGIGTGRGVVQRVCSPNFFCFVFVGYSYLDVARHDGEDELCMTWLLQVWCQERLSSYKLEGDWLCECEFDEYDFFTPGAMQVTVLSTDIFWLSDEYTL